ncbi:SulP family inorganic anion transporter [Jiangella anatolica]|uniref:Sodium-independent anion transporter n=1 Tax=Jiangella anatolica TaxID=2670374 RepID=A0A2W2BLC1_9ACTN|nr:SulP family inorganic anion transporter [Jiangella anatolica]PZF86130.1 sodium-independent anion transporter [Jiangella anatolica]
MRGLVPGWVRGYSRTWLRGDVLAGVTVTAYLVPQVMAYAELAGVPAQAGLWAVVGALTLYAFLGSSRLLSVGPESTTALMTAAALATVAGTGTDVTAAAAALALLVAGFCVLGWLLRLGALADLLSRPVLVGYLAGIAGIMVSSQLGKLLGVPEDADGFVAEVREVFGELDQMHGPTAALSLITLAAMLVAAARFPRAPVALVGMLGATAAAAILDLSDRGVRLVGEIPGGFPVPGVPDIGLSDLSAMLAPALGIAFVGYTDNILTGRGFATRHGQTIDPQRELLALGAANLGAGALQGMPVSSSGSRTAIADAVGGRTQLTGLVTVACTLLALITLKPVLAAFPLAALAAVVVYAATRLVDVAELVRFARFRRSELLLALATTAGVLVLDVLLGIVVAIALSVLDLLRRVARPHDAIQGIVPSLAGMHDVDDYPSAEVIPGLLVYRYDSPLFFANAENFRSRALAAVDAATEPVRWFLLNVEANVEIDVTGADAVESLRAELERRGIVLALARLKQDLRDQLAPTGLLGRIGEQHIFPTLPTAVEGFRAWEREEHP